MVHTFDFNEMEEVITTGLFIGISDDGDDEEEDEETMDDTDEEEEEVE